MSKFSASKSLEVIAKFLSKELGIRPLDKPTRTKFQLFEVSQSKKQFAIATGEFDAATGNFEPMQTRVVLEEAAPDGLIGVEPLRTHPQRKSDHLESPISRLKFGRQHFARVDSEIGLRRLLGWYVGVSPASTALPVIAVPATPPTNGRRPVTEEDLLEQLNRKSEVGRKGEEIAMAHEMGRLRDLGCSRPEDYVITHFRTNVGCGFDIETTWPGAERCIEVKSTTRAGSDIYLTANEREVLEKLGKKAWLYRVLVTPDGGHLLGEPLPDPITILEQKGGLSTAVWRAPDPSR